MVVYFDNAATTKVKEEVLNEMMPYFSDEYGNPSSIYNIGRKAKRAIEEAREKVANLIGADKNEIYFTSCGTESDNTALKGIAYKNNEKGNHIITTKIEHPAILDSCKELESQGFRVTYLNVDKDGVINLQELKDAITDETILISVMFANNEIGTIEPIEDISKMAKEKKIIFHTDAVQAVGNVDIDVKKMGIDMLSMSGHKIYAPKGIGALYVNKNVEFNKFMNGGHQEKNKRAGTESTTNIVGLGKACELSKMRFYEHINYIKELRDYYVMQVKEKITDIKINGSINSRLPGNSSISFKGIDAEALLFELDKKGICASSGSACTSGINEPSHVLTAIGLSNEYLKGTLRVTFGEFNTKAQIDYLVENLVDIINKIRNT